MKKLKILIVSLLFVIGTTFSQTKLDSISIYYPTKNLKLKTFKSLDSLDYNLNKLNEKYKTNEFIIHYYRSDGIIMRCRVKPVKETDKKLIVI